MYTFFFKFSQLTSIQILFGCCFSFYCELSKIISYVTQHVQDVPNNFAVVTRLSISSTQNT